MSSARRREAEHILKLCLGDHLRAYQLVERQLSRAILRAMVLIVLSGVVVAASGFSAHAIAQTGAAARFCMAAGLLTILVSSLVAVGGVLRLRWLSQEIDDEPVVTLLRGLEVRDQKTRNLRWAVGLFLIGFALYCAAIYLLLLS